MPSIEFITVLGAAGVALWVIWLIVGGKLHSDSEVQGLRADKALLNDANVELRATLGEAIPLLRSILVLLREPEEEA